MNAITKQDGMALIEQVVMGGDLSKLTPKDRLAYYARVCDSVGINPLTKPFDYLNLSGKLVLYANRGATEQLRKVHGVSVTEMAKEVIEGIYVVTATFTDKTGRKDQATGAVPITGLKGEALANAMLKAETKCKRRGTLSICGLGMLDETEVVTIAGAKAIRVDAETGEILEPVTTVHKATDGAEERLDEAQRRKVQGIVEAMQLAIETNRYDLAVKEFDGSSMDSDEQVYCWTHFDAPTRRKLKDTAKPPVKAA